MDEFIPTNTLSNTNFFDILKMDGVEDPLINLNKYTSVDFDESYTAIGLKFISEIDTELTDNKIRFYHFLSEATDDVAVLESFADYFSRAKGVIDKILKFLRRLVDNFISALSRFIDQDSYVKKHVDDLKNFSNKDKFSYTGYRFSFNDNIPSSRALASFDANLFSEIDLKGAGPRSHILNGDVMNNAMNSRSNMELVYDNFRGEILGLGSPVSVGEYQDELFKVYRSNRSDTEELNVDTTYVREVVDRYKKYKNDVKVIERQRDEVEKVYRSIQKQISDVTKENGNLNSAAFMNNMSNLGIKIKDIYNNQTDINGINKAADTMQMVDKYMRSKIDELIQKSNIHIQAFTAKLNAMQEAYKQDRNVIYSALSKMNKLINNPFKEDAEILDEKFAYKIGDWLDNREEKRINKLEEKLKKEGVKIPNGMRPYSHTEGNKLILVDKKDKVYIYTITTGNIQDTGESIYEYKQHANKGSDTMIVVAKTASKAL